LALTATIAISFAHHLWLAALVNDRLTTIFVRHRRRTLLGAVAGYAGGWLDNLIMRVMDVLLAFELAPGDCRRDGAGPGLINALLAIGIVSIRFMPGSSGASVPGPSKS